MKNRTKKAIEKYNLTMVSTDESINKYHDGHFCHIDTNGRLKPIKKQDSFSQNWLDVTIKQGCLYGRLK